MNNPAQDGQKTAEALWNLFYLKKELTEQEQEARASLVVLKYDYFLKSMTIDESAFKLLTNQNPFGVDVLQWLKEFLKTNNHYTEPSDKWLYIVSFINTLTDNNFDVDTFSKLFNYLNEDSFPTTSEEGH